MEIKVAVKLQRDEKGVVYIRTNNPIFSQEGAGQRSRRGLFVCVVFNGTSAQKGY